MYFDAEEGNWDQGTWRWSERVSALVLVRDLIPVGELMQQPPEWNGEGLPPVGTECEAMICRDVLIADWYKGIVVAHHWTKAVVYSEQLNAYYGVGINSLRPIKSEREKAIEAISLAISRSTYLTKDLTNAIAAALYNEGYRKVEK